MSFLRTIYESNWAKKYIKAIEASTSIYFGFGLLQNEDKLLAVIWDLFESYSLIVHSYFSFNSGVDITWWIKGLIKMEL